MDVKVWRSVQHIRPQPRYNPYVDVDPSVVHKDHSDPLIGPSSVRATPKALLEMTGFDITSHKRIYSALLSAQAFIQTNAPYRVHPVVAAGMAVIAGFTILFVTSGVAYAAIMDKPMPTTPKAVMAAVSKAIPAAAHPNKPAQAAQPKKPTTPALAPATDGIPAGVMTLYRDAAASCGMEWEIVAAVGKVETNHGQSNAPGVHSGANFAGAEGPMQFMPATWAKYGIDGNHNGTANIYDQADAIYSAANYMCANGAADPSKVGNAVWHYNHDQAYVNNVIAISKQYQSGAYVVPIPLAAAQAVNLGKPHHDYPADDIPVPVGTPVYAAHGGVARTLTNGACGYGVIITGTDGNIYTYCHASSVEVRNGATVNTGDPILHSGGMPGMPGAGDSTGPHLHFQINAHGHNVCPQGLLAAWQQGKFQTPQSATSGGCSY